MAAPGAADARARPEFERLELQLRAAVCAMPDIDGREPRERQCDRARFGDALEAGRERYPVQGRGAVGSDCPVANQRRPVRRAGHRLLDEGAAVAENASDVVSARNVLPLTARGRSLFAEFRCSGSLAMSD